MVAMALAGWEAGAGRAFESLAHFAGPAAVAALWQGAVLAAALAVCLRLLPRISAADRFRIWAASFAALAALPFLPILNAIHFGAGAAAEAPTTVGPVARAWLDLDPRWTLVIAALWLAASFWRAAILAAHSLRLRRLWKSASPIDDAELGAKLCAALGNGSKPVQVCSTDQLDRPSVIGFFAPRILIPGWLLGRLTPGELEQVVLHEAEHLRRRDDWTNLLQKLCLILFPLNPALAWMERRLCREREMACDEGVVRRTQAPREYAACLASLAERRIEYRLGRKIGRRAEALELGAWRRRAELVDRVHRILRIGPGLHPVAARALVGVIGCGLLFGSIEFARCPQLVAFVAPPKAEPVLVGDEGDAVVNPPLAGAPLPAGARAGLAFRAMNAVAKMPGTIAPAGKGLWSPTLPAEKRRKGGARDFGGATQAVNGEMAQAASAPNLKFDEVGSTEMQFAAPAIGQQFVVLTTWEQVETVRPGDARNESETYEASTSAAQTASAADAQTQMAPATRQLTVTRLILRVYPGNNARSTTAPGAGSGSSSASPQQMIPLRDGWLVIQL